MVLAIVLAGVFGALIGSFLNVVIYRLPRGMPMGMERSQCPHCGTQIAGYDNIPVLSYIVLGGRCRHCKTGISPRYPFVELLTAVLFALCAQRTLVESWQPPIGAFLVLGTVCAVLVSAAFIDIDRKEIPPVFTLRILPVLGLLGSVLVPDLHGTRVFGFELAGEMKPGAASLLVALAGALVGFAVMAGIRFLGSRIAGREAMGGGDVRLMTALGLLLGPVGVLLAIGLGFVIGAPAGIVWRLRRSAGGAREFPFGPSLALASVAILLYRDPILSLLGL